MGSQRYAYIMCAIQKGWILIRTCIYINAGDYVFAVTSHISQYSVLLPMLETYANYTNQTNIRRTIVTRSSRKVDPKTALETRTHQGQNRRCNHTPPTQVHALAHTHFLVVVFSLTGFLSHKKCYMRHFSKLSKDGITKKIPFNTGQLYFWRGSTVCLQVFIFCEFKMTHLLIFKCMHA